VAFLDRETIARAFDLLNAELARREQRADLFLVGGAVMCLVYETRASTRDVDGWFTNPSAVRVAAGVVAEELDLAPDWLNDAAKAYVPGNAGYETWRVLSHVTIAAVDASTLLAMKCAAARTAEDAADIRTLAQVLNLGDSRAILDVVARYFAEDRLPVRTRLLLEEMFDDRK
jgi:predicted nucleotidyltransferase